MNKVLKVKVKPNAPVSKIMDHCSRKDLDFEIHLKSTPENNKANKELRDLISERFSVAKKSVKIISGISNRIKLIKIDNE